MAFCKVTSKIQDRLERKPSVAVEVSLSSFWRGEPNWWSMTLIIIIVVLLLLFGGGGGYYAHRSYGLPGLGGVVGLILVVLVLLWLFGGLRLGHL